MNYKIGLLQNIIDYPGKVDYDGKQFDISKLKIQYEVGEAFNSNGVKEAIYNDFDPNKVVFGEYPGKVLDVNTAIEEIQNYREQAYRKKADRWISDINVDIKSALGRDPTCKETAIDSFRLQQWPVLSKKAAEVEDCIKKDFEVWKNAKSSGQHDCGLSAVKYLIPNDTSIYMALSDFIKQGYTIEVRKVESMHFNWHKPKFWQKDILVAKQFEPELNLTTISFLNGLNKAEFDELWGEVKQTGKLDIDLWVVFIKWDEFPDKEK